jgi:subtilase family serine protease
MLAMIGGAAAAAGGLFGAAGPAATAAPPPGIAVLPGSLAPFTAHARATGAVPAGSAMTIQVWLRPAKQAAGERFAVAVSTPGSPAFQSYLSPAAYTARFGASRGEARAVIAWLRGAGFSHVHADAQRSYVRATAPVSAVNSAFGVQMRYYRSSAAANAGPYRLRSNDRPVSVPRRLASAVLGVTGLDNSAPVISLARQGDVSAGRTISARAAHRASCSHYYGQHIVTGLPRRFGTTKFPAFICGYTARQLRSAYGVGMSSTGTGQTIAVTELGLTRQMFRTLRDYAAASKMPAPSPRRYKQLSLGRGSACGDPFDGEEQLDVEASYDMAPGAHQLVVGGDSCNNGDFGLQGLLDTVMKVLNGTGAKPLATVVSNSWGSGFETQPAALTEIDHAFLVRAAAEGVGMYFSSGDISGPQEPAIDPLAIAVGGTTLGIGKTGHRQFETGWSDGESIEFHGKWRLHVEVGAAGGGPSLLWKQPDYQQGVVPPALSTVAGDRGNGPVRSAPDISADADLFTGFALGELTFGAHGKARFGESAIGGTSLAAPLVAGMVIDAQQGQPKSFGFTNPAFYKLIGTSAFLDPLPLTHASPVIRRAIVCPAAACGVNTLIATDGQGPHTPFFAYAGQVTLRGYDSMTGVGTPRWPQFIAALRSFEQ